MDPDALQAELERLRLENEQLIESLRLIEQAQDCYVDLFDLAPVAYMTIDGVGAIHRLNFALAELFGEPRDRRRLVGRRLRNLIRPEDEEALADHVRNCAHATGTVSCEVRLLNGRAVRLASRRSLSEAHRYQTVVLDLGERDRAEQEARRLFDAERTAREASDAKDKFIAMLSHELRTPLTPVLAAISALLGRADVPLWLRPIFEMVSRNVHTEARLIDDLLDVTRIVRSKLVIERHPVDVHAVVRDAIDTLAADVKRKQLSLGVHLDADEHGANADPMRLKQVFWNLLRNAIKFTPEGGRIDLHSWNSGNDGARRLAVEVSDSGAGFDPAVSARLFEAFEQGPDVPDRTGLGLGLAICRGVMEAHGGTITATSRGPGLGARFVVEIGTGVQVPAAAAPPAVRAPRPSHAPATILVVDDHEETADTFADLLSDLGYDVRIAYSAEAALAGDLNGIDLVVSDIGLPGMDGRDLMRTLKTSHSLPGVALSGYGSEADIRASKEAGFSAHLTKPVDFDRLVATLREALASTPAH
jgi:PAS domain S-box-containing protein